MPLRKAAERTIPLGVIRGDPDMRAFLYKLIHETIAVGRAARGQFPAGLLLASPAMGQSGTMHRYAEFFKYSDSAVKAMTDNPQGRSAQAAKLFESLGGKIENTYWFPTSGGIRQDGHRPSPGCCHRGGDSALR